MVVLYKWIKLELKITNLKINMKENGSSYFEDLQLVMKKEQQSLEYQKVFLSHKKTDMAIEISLQIIIGEFSTIYLSFQFFTDDCLDILMLLLLRANAGSKQISGLEELFNMAEWFFYFAFLVTQKNFASTNVDLIKLRKGFLRLSGELG